MGLDSFWHNADGKVDENEEEYNLCGGMFSSNGNGSFRGKVYNPLVEHVTDVSLYQEDIPNDVVKQMAEALSKWEEHGDKYMLNTIKQAYGGSLQYFGIGEYEEKHYDDGDTNLRQNVDNMLLEFKNLVRMFNDYAKRGASLSGWW